MQIIVKRTTTTILQTQKYCFSGSTMLWNSYEDPVKNRVMSTPTWPAPYYQRIVKAYPIRGI